jgi:1-acyl-sn-glycerol-3-phosphate acyltransferase
MYKAARIVVGNAYKILFRIRAKGLENIPKDGGVILCANHTSYSDVPILGMLSPRDVHFLAKEELFKKRFFSKLFKKLGAISVNREKPGMDTLKQVVKLLKNGGTLGIFMQGGRRSEGDADDYKAGVALFAIKGQVPVVPVNIKSKFRLFSKVYVNFGKPISFEELWGQKLRTEQLNPAAQQIMDAIHNLEEKP